jgi:predicted transcriptional regulator
MTYGIKSKSKVGVKLKHAQMENIELRIKVQQLELENKELKKELERLLNTYKPSESYDVMSLFREVEEKLNNEEFFEEERETYRSLGSARKRDKEILTALSMNNGLTRDEIINLFFREHKQPVTCVNTVMKRLFRDGHVRIDKKVNPYKYYSKHNFQKPKRDGYVYFIKEFHTNTYKIGKAKNIENRLRMFNVKLPFEWEMVHHIETSDYSLAEKLIHKMYDNKRIERTEWFELTKQNIKDIKDNKFDKEIIDLLK